MGLTARLRPSSRVQSVAVSALESQRKIIISITGRSSGIPERADTEAGFRACLAAFGSSRSAAGSRSSFLLEDWSFREQISLEKAIKVTVAAPDPLEEHRGVLHLLPHIVGEQLLQPSGEILLQIRRTCEDDRPTSSSQVVRNLSRQSVRADTSLSIVKLGGRDRPGCWRRRVPRTGADRRRFRRPRWRGSGYRTSRRVTRERRRGRCRRALS